MFRKGLLGGAMKYNVWNKLVKRSLYTDNGILFPAGHAMGEDMTMIRLAACAESVAYVPKAFYHYVKLNANAYSATMSDRHKADIRFNVDQTVEFLKKRSGNALDKEIAFFKLNTKLPFLITDNEEEYEVWKEWWPEANKYICENKHQAFRTRMIQWLAAKGQFWAVKVYFKLVYSGRNRTTTFFLLGIEIENCCTICSLSNSVSRLCVVENSVGEGSLA
jgi:hypothetical protein